MGEDAYRRAVSEVGEDGLILAVLKAMAEHKNVQPPSGSFGSSSGGSHWWDELGGCLFWAWLALLGAAPGVALAILGVVVGIWVIVWLWKAIDEGDLSGGEVVGGLVGLGVLGAIGYGIYRAAPFVWTSTVAWWRWLAGQFGVG